MNPLPRGRGTGLVPDNRFSDVQREAHDDGWPGDADETLDRPPATQVRIDTAKTVISRNASPDVPFSTSINPYRGCEHGCSYCFARPTHAYLGLSPGLDFETQLAWKPDAPQRLREELSARSYRPSPIALGVNTDAYQPIERQLGLTRALLEVLRKARHPVSIITKGALIERDIDLLADLARDDLVQVMFSITTLDAELARRMEPRAASPARRLSAMRALHDAGIPVGVLCAPVIPALNDHELESVLSASQAAGAQSAGYVLLRLPLEVADIFRDWLARHYPGRAAHVMSLMRQMREGHDYAPAFGQRMRGSGPLADLLSQRFMLLCTRLGLNREPRELDCSRFRAPTGPQASLF